MSLEFYFPHILYLLKKIITDTYIFTSAAASMYFVQKMYYDDGKYIYLYKRKKNERSKLFTNHHKILILIYLFVA